MYVVFVQPELGIIEVCADGHGGGKRARFSFFCFFPLVHGRPKRTDAAKKRPGGRAICTLFGEISKDSGEWKMPKYLDLI